MASSWIKNASERINKNAKGILGRAAIYHTFKCMGNPFYNGEESDW